MTLLIMFPAVELTHVDNMQTKLSAFSLFLRGRRPIGIHDTLDANIEVNNKQKNNGDATTYLFDMRDIFS